jgi:hypothetical protein
MSIERRSPKQNQRTLHPLAKRLEDVRTRHRIPNIKAFWRKVEAKCTYEAAKRYHADREAPPSYLAAVIVQFPDVSAEWLLTDRGPKWKRQDRVLAAQDWTQGDVADLRDRLARYSAGVVTDRLVETHPGPELPDGDATVRGTPVSARDVLGMMGDDPLEHLTRHIYRLTDRLVARERRRLNDRDAEQWRAFQRAKRNTTKKGGP